MKRMSDEIDEFGLSPSDYEIVDGKRIVKDGRSVRVPLMMCDAAPPERSVNDRARVVDANGSAMLHRPGYRYIRGRTADDQMVLDGRDVLRDDAYAAYDAEISSAWRNPPTGAGSHGPIGQRAGDLCTINGWPGHLEDIDGELVCVPDRGRQDGMTADEIAADHYHRMAQIYDQLDRELSEAWRRR